jgi:hypothetical protein
MLCNVTQMLVIISRAPEDGSINPFQKVIVYKYVYICNELLSRRRAGPDNTHTPLPSTEICESYKPHKLVSDVTPNPCSVEIRL